MVSTHARLLVGHITAIDLYATLCGAREETFLPESASEGVWSRYSFVGMRCGATLAEHGGEAVWLGRKLVGIDDGDPLDALRQTLVELATPVTKGLPPFHAGMVGRLDYGAVRWLETLPDTCIDDLKPPEPVIMLASQVAVLGHRMREVHLIFNTINYDDIDEGVEWAYHEALVDIGETVGRPAGPTPSLVEPARDDLADLEIRRQRTPAEYEQVVRATIAEIEAGGTFQVAVSQRFDVPTGSDALEVYRALRLTNPNPYLYLLRLPGLAVTGSSPEALMAAQDDTVTTRPIADPRPRDSTEVEGRELATEPLVDPEGRTEHLMLVGLGCNNLGHIYELGSVTVHKFMQTHRYSHTVHLEATVNGRLAEGHTALDATLPCFPTGTLFGAPKVRAMEIIDRLEVSRHGLHGDAVDYFGLTGNSDVAITIRITMLKNGIAHVQAGAGIVADSALERGDTECSYETATVVAALRRAAKLGETT